MRSDRMKRMAMAAALACGLGSAAHAEGDATSSSDRATLTLAPGWVEPGGDRMAGLAMTLAPGWKTYWRAPGDAGIPPLFDWSGSDNLAAVEVIWPAPELFDSFGLTTIGYQKNVTLPLRLTPIDPTRPVDLRLTLDYGVCAEICVPERAELALQVAPEGAAAPFGPIADALARQPLSGVEAGVARAECAVRGAGPERRFEASLHFEGSPPRDATLVVEGPPGAWFGPAETRIEGSTFHAEAEAQIWDEAAWISREALRLTLLGGARAIEVRGCVASEG